MRKPILEPNYLVAIQNLGEHDRRTAPVRAERAPQVAKRRWNIPARPFAAVAQRVEVVSPSEIRILGTKTELLRTLVAAAGVESAAAGVRSFIPKWRAIQNKTANSYVIETAI
jgi:hypothetical protein